MQCLRFLSCIQKGIRVLVWGCRSRPGGSLREFRGAFHVAVVGDFLGGIKVQGLGGGGGGARFRSQKGTLTRTVLRC